MKNKNQKKLEAEVSKMEDQIRKQKAKLAVLRRKIPATSVKDYSLLDSSGKKTQLSKLFSGKNELILIHNMGKSCNYCALWADGFNGVLKHLEDRVGFAVESPDSPSDQKKLSAKKKWNFKFVSSQGSSFRKDMGFSGKNGDPWPGVSIFKKDKNGEIYQVAKTLFGPGDNYCNVWDLFDLLPTGKTEWHPKGSY